MIRLSKRMQALADMVTPEGVLCDVGCDHGFLPIYLLQQKKIKKAIAMDVAEGPLQAAREHIALHQMKDNIETRRSDGLEHLAPNEADTILIAGMGGGLVIHILSAHPTVAASAKELILQPQSELYQVRKYLWEQGYELLDEDMIFEDGKYYPMMKVKPANKAKEETPREIDLYFGKKLIEKKHPVLQQYLQREARIQSQVLKQLLAQKSTEAIEARIAQVRQYQGQIEECQHESM